MERILRPLGRSQDLSPLAAGFGQMARIIGAALGEGPAVSRRTELFRPLPADPIAWLFDTFPTYFQNARGERVPLAAHHTEWWQWLWALRPGEPAQTFISIWGRGGGKSTSLELGAACVGYFGLRRYTLYICGTQRQANDHLGNVGRLLEGLGIERAINRYGFSQGWNLQRLTTADGYTADAIGLDTAARGVRIDEARPDFLLFDELDEKHDTLATTAKKIETLTETLLPTIAIGSAAVAGVQNLPNADGIFAQLADGRAEFLYDRYVSGPHPSVADLPEQDWYTQGQAADGKLHLRLVGGRPVWAGQDRAACEGLLTLIGARAFEIECLHRVGSMTGSVFRREWFRVVEDWPRGASLVRAWDFAATEEPESIRRGKDPDWTVGLLLAMWQGQFWVVDVVRMRGTPFDVQRVVKQTAQTDGRSVEIWLEEEGGAAGKSVTADYQRNVLIGYAVRAWHSTGSKAERAKTVSAAAQAGNVFLVRGYWNTVFLEEVPRFLLPRVHDDQVDALALAHYALTLGRTLLPSDFSLTPYVEGLGQRSLEGRAQVAELLPAMAALWGVEQEEEIL